jgi:hypothetical protein
LNLHGEISVCEWVTKLGVQPGIIGVQKPG